MRPRKFALPQAGTGGYGILPYVEKGRILCAREVCLTASGRMDRRGRCPAWSCVSFVESEIRRGAFYMRRGSYPCRASGHGRIWNPPVRFCARGGLSCRKRGAAKGRVFACCACKRIYFRLRLVKTILCGILFLYKSTGKPGANRRRKAIGTHRVSQLPTRNCCFTAAGSFASFLGQELTRVKTHRYAGGSKQGIYNALLFSAARGYCLIRSDSAFRYGSAMP